MNRPFAIRAHRCLCPGYYRLDLDAPELAGTAAPGQFCMLSVPGVFLRRPLSIAGASDGVVSFLYKVVGTGTRNLTELVPGTVLQVLGPLGTGYDLQPLSAGAMPLLVGGGTGIASISFLHEKLAADGRRSVVFYGARCRDDLPAAGMFSLGSDGLRMCTEDGSAGEKGYVTDELLRFLGTTGRRDFVVYACGPHPMLERVAGIARQHGLKGFVSLEARMACGVGNCQGCAVRIAGEHRMVCKDGPVFPMEDVEW